MRLSTDPVDSFRLISSAAGRQINRLVGDCDRCSFLSNGFGVASVSLFFWLVLDVIDSGDAQGEQTS